MEMYVKVKEINLRCNLQGCQSLKKRMKEGKKAQKETAKQNIERKKRRERERKKKSLSGRRNPSFSVVRECTSNKRSI